MRPIEDEERLYRKGEQTKKTVVEGSQGGVSSALAGLDLEVPDGDIDCDAKGATGLFEVFAGEFGEGGSFAGADLFVDAEGGLVWR